MHKSQIYAHRGANQEAAENMRSAFDQALAYPIDGIETDVQLSRDEVAVLWHDRFLDKLGLPDQHIDDLDYAQLQTMNFAQHFSASANESIMTLQAFLDAYGKRCQLLLEIKNRDWETVERHQIKVRQTLSIAGPSSDDRLMASSFDLNSLIYAQQYMPGFPLIYNFETEQTLTQAKQLLASHSFLRGLCLPIATLNADFVSLLRNHNKCIAVYTCNSVAEINKALDFGVDILISDVPQLALKIRDQ